MKSWILRGTAGLCLVASVGLVSGCGNEEIKLQEAPPAAIAPVKDEKATDNSGDLKKGAPPKGSSAGLNFNPNQTPAAK